MFTRIVVGCNGAPEGEDAAALGALLGQTTGAGISLLTAYPTPLFPVPGESDRATLRRQAETALREARHAWCPTALTDAVADNSAARAVRHYAERWHAELVVVGASRHALEGHVALGRTARQLIYGAPYALAVAARGSRSAGMRLRAIGVGYDGGPESVRALELATALARPSGARLHVRHVVEDQVPALSAEEWVVRKDWAHMWEGERTRTEAETERMVADLGVPVEVSATVGDPGYELRALTETVDLLVVGSRRWGTAARLVTGGAGETLVADSSCSLLIVPRAAVETPNRDHAASAAGEPAETADGGGEDAEGERAPAARRP